MGHHLAQGLTRVLLGEQLADRRASEERLELGHPLIEPLVQGAQARPMRGKLQWTAIDPLLGVNGVDDNQPPPAEPVV